MYHLIGLPRTRTFRVMWCLEELGLEYTQHAAAPRSTDVTQHSHLGKVPVLMDGEIAISDSVAIMTYLADKHGALTYPAGTLERARQDAITHQILDELDSVLWTAARHSFILPEDKRVPAVKEALKWEFGLNATRLSERLIGPYLAGDQFTIVDILAVHCLGWSKTAKFDITDRPLLDYAKRMRQRPAYLATDQRAN